MRFALAVLLLRLAARGGAAVRSVGAGGDFATIQSALEAADPGDVVRAAPGALRRTAPLPNGGDAIAGFLWLEVAPGAHPILDGSGLASGAPAIEIPSPKACLHAQEPGHRGLHLE